MLFDLAKQLDALTNTLRLVSNVIVPVEPGQKVELEVLSAAPDLFVTDKVLDNPLLAGTAQLLTQIPVEIRVAWSVTDGAERLSPGVDFLATNEMRGPSVDFIFKPPFLELGTVKPLVDDSLRIITARVTLRAWPNNVALNAPSTAVPQEVVSKEVKLNLILSLVPLEIPTLLALFRFEDFRALGKADLTPGFVLMVMPKHSYLGELVENMNEVLVRIEEAVRPIRTLLGLAAFLAGLNILRQALTAQPMLRAFHGTEIDDLDNIHMRVDTRFGSDFLKRDLRPNDRVSSLIFLGVPGKKVTCFADTDQDPDDGAFEVHLGTEMIAVVPTLRLKQAPHPAVTVIDNTDSGNNNFDDSLSSLRFD